MSSMASNRRKPDPLPILSGCLGALVMSLVSGFLLLLLAFGPALGGTVPAPPPDDPAQPHVTVIVGEPYINRVMAESLPGGDSTEARLDIQPDNRMVFTADVNLLLVEVNVVVTLRLTADAGQLRLELVSVEAGGSDLMELIDMDASALTDAISDAIQDQVEAGLGEGAQIMDIRTDDQHLVIVARWAR
jgi:hypothetical protein